MLNIYYIIKNYYKGQFFENKVWGMKMKNRIILWKYVLFRIFYGANFSIEMFDQ